MQTLTHYNENSLFAFLNVQPKLSDRQREVYEAMRMMNRAFTDKDLAHYMNFEINRITPRRGEIAKKGLIRKVGNIIQEGRSATLWEVGQII